MTRSLSSPVPAFASVESRASWVVAGASLAILSFSYGAPYLVAVGMRPIAEELGSARSVPSLAASLAWFGGGVGGMLMGWLAEKVGVRWTVLVGAVMVGFGLFVSTLGGPWALWLGHGLFVGLLGNGGINVPLMTYVTRWFDRRRGTALALIASGQYIAGVIWPGIFERGIATLGWRTTMALYGGLVVVAVIPLAAVFLRAPPKAIRLAIGTAGESPNTRGAAHPNRAFFVLLCCAPFLCCVPMAMPQGHLVAFCGDLGISAAHGAAMLSVLLGSAFVARQFWGWLSDRIGGMTTVLIGSVCQVAALIAFLLTQDERGLYFVAAAFGMGFSGLIPAYVLAVRDLFPAEEAGWRVPMVFFAGTGGMAFGGWMAGAIYDQSGTYAAAWMVGIGVNALHFVLVGALILWWRAARAR
jgi:MFS family permease